MFNFFYDLRIFLNLFYIIRSKERFHGAPNLPTFKMGQKSGVFFEKNWGLERPRGERKSLIIKLIKTRGIDYPLSFSLFESIDNIDLYIGL